jgi:hypothetical protein
VRFRNYGELQPVLPIEGRFRQNRPFEHQLRQRLRLSNRLIVFFAMWAYLARITAPTLAIIGD